MHLQIVHVVSKLLQTQHLHTPGHSTFQTRTPVAAEIKATDTLEVVQQSFEFFFTRFGAHRASPFMTRVTNAEEISASGKIKSALPV